MDITISLLSFFTSLLIAIIIAPFLIPYLRKIKFGQQIITDYGPTWHKSKQGTPTMGGFIFIGSVLVSYLIYGFQYYTKGELFSISSVLPSSALTALIVSLLFSLMGFADDFVKVSKKRNLGLTAKQKMILQILISAAYIIYIAIKTNTRTSVDIPFTNITLELSYFYYVFALFAMVGFVNAVNLTDGIDGLCTSVTLPVSIFFALAATIKGASDISVLASALAGGCIGFLVFNWHPAKVFMGDTGSMFLGGMVVTFAFALDMPLILVIAGFIYMIEAFSVMIQVAYFKITKGKRLFKMTPIHHSFELSGYSEVKIVF
ncbi:MAG: phospho-N-acetylmuramoyl-pentapeptide-transferase, partial [Clostridia bacterium]|nr:phospho-N-acetylmuramoyl-pentapeptide-transferase [Clostridia bacterium]